MSAPKGNEFWKARSTHGRAPIFATPDILMDACAEYFAWVEQNPLYEGKAFSYEGKVTIASVPKMRAMTISGLCIFLDIGRRSWDEYRKRQEYLPVCEAVEEVIRQQKFEGASAGLLNHAIIARDLGLVDKSELTGANGDPLVPQTATDNEIARRVAFLLAKGIRADATE